MNLTQLKKALHSRKTLIFELPSGELVPRHFHVTEIGKIQKEFIDCGGTIRKEEVIGFQLWSADDYDHRLHPEKLLQIINLAEEQFQLPDAEIEVEYQGETIQTFGLAFVENRFLLTPKQTDCLAKENCGIPAQKPKQTFSKLQTVQSSCEPGSGCC